MTVHPIGIGKPLQECRTEKVLAGRIFNEARRLKENRGSPCEAKSFRASLRLTEVAFVLIFSRQDCLFCLPRSIPPAVRHETR
jgi:hypothetical protein